ncbi:MAG: hypothetical protein HOQ09_07435, partial [Gemmatimonadaceae bacterium]|nr:hypothetical protein [Gemmatimonadaceae bacterium]
MNGVVLYDDARARRFEPFALTRPVAELRSGALLVRERWARALGMAAIGFASAPHLADFEEEDAPGAVGSIPRGAVLANARFSPALAAAPREASRWIADGRVAAVRLARDLTVEE